MCYKIITEDIESVLSEQLPWNELSGKTICVTGANGMLAAYVVETLLALSSRLDRGVQVVALVRNVNKCSARFARWLDCSNLIVKKWDFEDADIGVPDCNIMIHAASVPRPDSQKPVDVIGPNVVGTWNLLWYCHKYCKVFEQFLFFSSCGVYGDDFLEDYPVREDMAFALNQMLPSSCYAEAKKMGENLCVCFMRQYGIAVKILRYAHTYGPGMDLENDPRSFVSFVRSMISGEDIVLFSNGDMSRCFCYISDATNAFFRVLFYGNKGEAYNIANEEERLTILELAILIARLFGRPSACVKKSNKNSSVDAGGYAPQRYTIRPDITKLKKLGFEPHVSTEEGFKRSIRFLLNT